MPLWGYIAIAAAVVILLIVFVATAVRRRHLRSRFGPEYDRAKNSDLRKREKRVDELDIVPLSAVARQRYMNQWQSLQSRFVDHPSNAVRDADALVATVMNERGYPVDDFEQRSADISVDHPRVVQNYRAAHAISLASDHGQASTEDLRQAMVHYRTLFEDLLGDDAQDRRVS
jgi:predicted nucleic acid-binding protein